MQTFLPLPSFIESAKVLDDKRLGKQRVDAFQILRTISSYSRGWLTHPCIRQWKPYPLALIDYGMSICNEWISRGYEDNLLPKFKESQQFLNRSYSYKIPSWLGDEKYHASHQSNLLKKDFSYYSQFQWEVPLNLEYIWPI